MLNQTRFGSNSSHYTEFQNSSASTLIDRRHFLKGLGVAFALPAFESFNSGYAASAKTADPRKPVCVGSQFGFGRVGFSETSGKDYRTSQTLKPIDRHREDLFPNLDHDVNGGHSYVHSFLSGVEKSESGTAEKNMTIDQAAANFRAVALATRRYGGYWRWDGYVLDPIGREYSPVSNPARLFEALSERG